MCGKIRSFPYRIVGLILLAYLLSSVDITDVGGHLKSMRATSVVIAASPIFGLLAFRCWRWCELARAAGSSLRSSTLVVTCNESIWLGLASPARLGEFRRAAPLVSGKELGIAAATALIVFDLSMDLYAFAAAGVSGVAVQWMAGMLDIPGWAQGSLFTALLMAGFLLLTQIRWPLLLVSRWLPTSGRFSELGVLSSRLAANLTGTLPLRISIYTTVVLVSFVAMMGILISALDLNLDLVQTVTLIGLVGISGAIPITYFGFGTREAVLILYLGSLGYSAEKAIAVSAMFLVAFFLAIATSLLFGVVLRFYYGRSAS